MSFYPTNPHEWQLWIHEHLGISATEARELLKKNSFPKEDLEALWREKFCIEEGYVQDFIPALSRNMTGLLRWVYCGEEEPNWTRCD
ncbi:MAG: hypothetical protein ACFFEF_01160 [Candidatus Thorarchaeota archaeon]